MPRFFMHYHDGGVVTPDEDGYDVTHLCEMRAEAVWAAREMMAADLMKGQPLSLNNAFEVTDAEGRSLLRIRFEDTLDRTMPPKRLRGV